MNIYESNCCGKVFTSRMRTWTEFHILICCYIQAVLLPYSGLIATAQWYMYILHSSRVLLSTVHNCFAWWISCTGKDSQPPGLDESLGERTHRSSWSWRRQQRRGSSSYWQVSRLTSTSLLCSI